MHSLTFAGMCTYLRIDSSLECFRVVNNHSDCTEMELKLFDLMTLLKPLLSFLLGTMLTCARMPQTSKLPKPLEVLTLVDQLSPFD